MITIIDLNGDFREQKIRLGDYLKGLPDKLGNKDFSGTIISIDKVFSEKVKDIAGLHDKIKGDYNDRYITFVDYGLNLDGNHLDIHTENADYSDSWGVK